MGQDFEQVYEAHIWDVYGFLAYRSRSKAEAEDLTQQTFEKALAGWDRFDPERGSTKAWLLAIAQNAYVDARRREERRPEARLEDGGVEQSVPGAEERLGPDPELASAIQQLSQREREAIALRFGGDLKTVEVAEVLDVSVGNAQQILSRALRKLRSTLEEQPGGSVAEGAGAGGTEGGDG